MTFPSSPAAISFEPLRREHFGLLGQWLREPLVARWWCNDSSAAAMEAQYGPTLDRDGPDELFLALLDGAPFGFIQCYRIADYDDYFRALSTVCVVAPEALSVDYLVGVPAMRGRGLAAAMISALLQRIWPLYPNASDVVVPVHAANRASWRSLERAGFVRVARGELEPDNPMDSRDHVIYRFRRAS